MPKLRDAHELMQSLQLVVRNKPRRKAYLRSPPYTILYPKPAQRDIRRRVAKAAGKASGLRGLAPDGLPWAAHFVKRELSGYRSAEPKAEKEPLWKRRRAELSQIAVQLPISASREELRRALTAIVYARSLRPSVPARRGGSRRLAEA